MRVGVGWRNVLASYLRGGKNLVVVVMAVRMVPSTHVRYVCEQLPDSL